MRALYTFINILKLTVFNENIIRRAVDVSRTTYVVIAVRVYCTPCGIHRGCRVSRVDEGGNTVMTFSTSHLLLFLLLIPIALYTIHDGRRKKISNRRFWRLFQFQRFMVKRSFGFAYFINQCTLIRRHYYVVLFPSSKIIMRIIK